MNAAVTRSGWLKNPLVFVVAGGIVMGLALGVRHAQGMFLIPITMDRALTREAFAMAIAIQNLIWGLAQPFTGMIADRFGAIRVIAGGLLCYAAGLFLMAFAVTPLQFTLTTGLCIGIGLSGTSFGVIYGALSRMVAPERRSWALGLAGAVGGLGQFFMVPLTQSLIGMVGWATALLILAMMCCALLPCALPMQDHPAANAHQAEQTLAAALGEAFRHRGFWLLNVGFLACGFQLAFIATHLPAYLLDRGLSASDAVTGLALIAFTNVIGTYYCGLFGDLYRRKYLLSALYLIRSLAMALFVLLPLTTWSLYLFCAVMGLLWLGTVPLTNGLISQMFGVRYITTLFGFVFFGHQLGAFFGVWLGGYVFDATHSYDLIWFIGIALGLMAALLHCPINDRTVIRPAMAPAAS